jgi:hypothetical protein
MKSALRGCGCVPFIVGYGAIYHASACRKSPNVRLGINEAEVWRAQNRAADKSADRHPAKGVQRPLRIVEDVAYMDHHSDRDDDLGDEV